MREGGKLRDRDRERHWEKGREIKKEEEKLRERGKEIETERARVCREREKDCERGKSNSEIGRDWEGGRDCERKANWEREIQRVGEIERGRKINWEKGRETEKRERERESSYWFTGCQSETYIGLDISMMSLYNGAIYHYLYVLLIHDIWHVRFYYVSQCFHFKIGVNQSILVKR